MPYSPEQRALFGIALSMLKGKTPYSYSAAAAKIAKSSSKAELKRMLEEGVKKS